MPFEFSAEETQKKYSNVDSEHLFRSYPFTGIILSVHYKVFSFVVLVRIVFLKPLMAQRVTVNVIDYEFDLHSRK